MTEYSDMSEWDDEHIVSILTSFLKANKTAKMGDFATLFSGHLSRKQIRITIDKLVETGDIIYEGDGKSRTYSLSGSSKGQKTAENS